MDTVAFVTRIKPGKVAALTDFCAALESGQRPEVIDSHRRAGLVREQVFVQYAPMGELAIFVWDTDDAARVFRSFATDASDHGAWYRSELHEICGLDFFSSEEFVSPIICGEWLSKSWSLHGFEGSALCFPLATGKNHLARGWVTGLMPRGRYHQKYWRMCKKFGVTRQLFCAQQTPDGEIAIMYGEGVHDWFPNAYQSIAMSDDSFLKLWRTKLNDIAALIMFGADPTPPRVEQVLH
ncbi:MAG: hypothetical protein H7123_08205, partial [Thermoleophilia bacterium]|nr:hypothetical protein [Thermoleophilia bacterium]